MAILGQQCHEHPQPQWQGGEYPGHSWLGGSGRWWLPPSGFNLNPISDRIHSPLIAPNQLQPGNSQPHCCGWGCSWHRWPNLARCSGCSWLVGNGWEGWLSSWFFFIVCVMANEEQLMLGYFPSGFDLNPISDRILKEVATPAHCSPINCSQDVSHPASRGGDAHEIIDPICPHALAAVDWVAMGLI